MSERDYEHTGEELIMATSINRKLCMLDIWVSCLLLTG
jgi:hypothetical protein